MAIETKKHSLGNKRSPYRQLNEGEILSFTLYVPEPDGSVTTSYEEGIIESIKGGGFSGRVYLLKNKPYVLKTSVPDAWHDLWRRINWGFMDFPAQVDETQTKLDHLSTNLIADTLPVLTDSKFLAPYSLGYTELSNGYAQVVERMQGRPPRYDTGNNEFVEFKLAQWTLRQTAYDLGFEQAGQIHEKNPFGMANLYFDPENQRWIWLDTLPAIPHKSWVWPFFYFRFHKDVRDWFYPPESGPQQITFNRIHTDRLLHYVTTHRHRFTDEVYQRVMDNINHYEQLLKESQLQPEPVRNFRGVATASVEIVHDVIPVISSKILDFAKGFVKIMMDPNRIILQGVRNAYNQGIVTEDELKIAESSTDNTFLALRTLFFLYQGSGLVSKYFELSSYAYLIGRTAIDSPENTNLGPDLLAIFAIARAGGGLVKIAETHLAQKIHQADLTIARRLCPIPFIGDHLAIVAQAGSAARNSSKEIWHYTVRNLIAGLSSLPIFPDGGWGTEREGRWWQKWGRHLESWGGKTTSNNR